MLLIIFYKRNSYICDAFRNLRLFSRLLFSFGIMLNGVLKLYGYLLPKDENNNNNIVIFDELTRNKIIVKLKNKIVTMPVSRHYDSALEI